MRELAMIWFGRETEQSTLDQRFEGVTRGTAQRGFDRYDRERRAGQQAGRRQRTPRELV